MKKEARQNGTSRTQTTLPLPEYNPSGPNNYINRKLESESPPPPYRVRTCKAHPRPNNHSKSKGRWEENTGRGYYKKKSGGVLDRANHKLVTWRAVHNGPGLKFGGGFSAADVLDRLATQEYYDGDDCNAYDSDNASDDVEDTNPSHTPPEEGSGVNEEEEEEDGMSFCDVGFVVEDVIEVGEDWCLVDEL